MSKNHVSLRASGTSARVFDGVVGKLCRFYPDRRCFHSSCDLISSSGVVSVCGLYGGGDKFSRRKVGPVYVSVFSKHHVERKGGVFFG